MAVTKTRKPKQLAFEIPKWGGKRSGSGRKNKTREVNHMKREEISGRTPVHITIRLRPGLPGLRSRRTMNCLKQATMGATSHGLSVLQFSLLSNHLHIIAEVESNKLLGSGMRSLGGRLARRLRAVWSLSGKEWLKGIFQGRYHLQVIRTPTQMKNALRYVLLNHSKHAGLIDHLDPYSSAAYFSQWSKLLKGKPQSLMAHELKNRELHIYDDDWKMLLASPASWLARVGWQRGTG